MTNKVYQVPYGTKDILPGEMKSRRRMESAIMDVFDKWGYDEVKTPDFEYADIFGRGGAKSDFRFFDRENNLLALRNDMTAPIARLTATRLAGGEKIKRLCYLANLYRYEEIQAGRQCEFEQAGVELLGAAGAAADAEVIVLAAQALQAAGVSRFTLSVGHAGFINGVAEAAGFDEEQVTELQDCLRRRDAVGLQNLAQSAGNIPGKIKKLLADFIFLQGGREILKRMRDVISNEKAAGALDDLERICELVAAYGCAEKLSFDLGLYRSLDYYTGMLFEVYVPEIGYPIAGGGRYDKMMSTFGMDCPATGFALGVDRACLALARADALDSSRGWDVLVAWAQGRLPDAIRKATELRREGCSVKLCTEAMSAATAAAALKEYACSRLEYMV